MKKKNNLSIVLFCFPPLSLLGDEYYFRTQELMSTLKKDYQIKIIKPLSKTGIGPDRRFTFKKAFLFLFNIPSYLGKIKKAKVIVIFPSLIAYFWISAAKILGKKVVIDHFTTLVSFWEANKNVFKKMLATIDKWFYRKIDLVLTHTKTMEKEIINFYQLEKKKIIVIYSLVDSKLFNPNKLNLKKLNDLGGKYKIPKNKKVLLYHGQSHSSHGLIIIKKMAQLAWQKKKNYVFVFIRFRRRQPKQKENQYFLPHVSFKHLFQSLALADLWLGRFSRSKKAQRSASSCMMQAMAMKIPVITFNTKENRVIIKNGFNGFLTNSLNPKTILAQIDKIFKNKPLLRKVGHQARKTIKQDFSLKKWQSVNLAIKNLLKP